MTTNILTLKVGSKYGPEYVNRLNKSIRRNTKHDFKMFCLTEDPTGLDDDINVIPLTVVPHIKLQWYKMYFHNFFILHGAGINLGEKCIIMDIDQVIIGDIDPIMEWVVPANVMGLVQRWWSSRQDLCLINGGFQIFNANATQRLFDTFMDQPEHWQRHYIENGLADGPVNGEQNFIDEHWPVDQRTYIPKEWFAKYDEEKIRTIQRNWHEKVSKEEPFYLGDEFAPWIKVVHFSNADNRMEDHKLPWLELNWHD